MPKLSSENDSENDSNKQENILEAHYRIYGQLIFMISCYDTEYGIKYLKNLNNKTFDKYFTIVNTNDPKIINDTFENTNKKSIIFLTQLPTPEIYSFNFTKDVYHIHLAISFSKDKDSLNTYIDKIKQIPVQKFINIKDKKNIYNDSIEEQIYDSMIKLVDRKLNSKNENTYPRMPQTGGKIILYGERTVNY
jgi:hypothetical protein